ncbi:hypothetical protein CSUI_009036 [Cystoisospora suis]|uniref:Uncharacterized protein n=1 Tax=Cystoisospora suis TaxID=483139 RepID=A0A2C6KJ63_9APIC|nr:hypothetical protein CSUI_009036 [Cystoisospora suis]
MSKTHHPREGGSLAPPRPPAAKTPSPSCVSSSSSSSSRPSSFSSSTSPPLPSSPPFSSLPIRGRERHPSSRHTAPRPETSSSHTSPSSSSYSSSSSSPSSGSSLSSSPSSSPRERQRFFPPHSSSSSHPKHRQDSLSRSAEKSSHSHHPRTVSASTREVKTGEGRKSVQFTPPSPTTSSHSFPSDEGISKSVVHEAVPAELRGSSPPSPVRTSVYVTTRPFPSSSAKRDVAGMSSSSPTPGGWRRRGGEGRDGRFSPRLPCSKDGEPSSLDQVYIRRQRDGSMVMYLSAHLDKYLLRVFRTVSYNGFLTELRWVNMVYNMLLTAFWNV